MTDPSIIDLQRAALAHASAPEGLELFRWYRADGRYPEFRVPLLPATVSVTSPPAPDLLLAKPAYTRVQPCIRFRDDVTHHVAGVGWDAAQRVAVVFFGRGYACIPRPEPQDETVTDQGMQALADTGLPLLVEDCRREWREFFDSLPWEVRDALDLNHREDGDGWKDGS
jgi:hypothetical protein